MAGPSSAAPEQHEEHRQLLALKATAHQVAALFEQDGDASALARDADFGALLAQLRAYEARWPKPALIQIRHLVTLAEGLHKDLLSERTIEGISEGRRRFQPLLVALSRVGATPGSETLQQDRPQAAAEAFPLELVLVNLRSAFNVGSLVRTAECYGCSAVHVAGYTAGLDHPKVASVAMGCEQDMPWTHHPDPASLLAQLKGRGLSLIALETSAAATPLSELRLPFPAALIVGNERFGIEPDLLELCTHIVRLPMYGKKNSLNVASATAIAIHHARSCWPGRS